MLSDGSLQIFSFDVIRLDRFGSELSDVYESLITVARAITVGCIGWHVSSSIFMISNRRGGLFPGRFKDGRSIGLLISNVLSYDITANTLNMSSSVLTFVKQ